MATLVSLRASRRRHPRSRRRSAPPRPPQPATPRLPAHLSSWLGLAEDLLEALDCLDFLLSGAWLLPEAPPPEAGSIVPQLPTG